MGFGSETMFCKQFYAYDCEMDTSNHTFSEKSLLHVSYLPFLQVLMSEKNIIHQSVVFCFTLFIISAQLSVSGLNCDFLDYI